MRSRHGPTRSGPAIGGLDLVAVALAGLNLRAAIAALPALTGQIRRDTGLSLGEIGLLTALPVLCLGLAAPLATRIASRFGTERTIAAALATLAGGLTARHWSTTPAGLYATTLVAGVGVAIVGAALPGVVRERFACRVGSVTGLYTGAMALGASLAAGLAVPAEMLLGSWRDALALWALPALGGALAWLTLHRRRRRDPPPPSTPASTAPPRRPWRDRTAWVLTAYQTTQSVLAVSQLAWIGPAYTDLHQSARTAGLLAAGYAAAGVLATIAAPVLADRYPRRPLILGALTCALAGTVLLAVAPGLTPWGTVLLLGLGQTAGFALGLVLLAASTASPAAARALTAMTFLIAYPMAAAAPPVLGALRDATGTFTIPFLALATINLAALTLTRSLPTDTAPGPHTTRQVTISGGANSTNR
jgi:CP family cyanate transporter-like MFS transporter